MQVTYDLEYCVCVTSILGNVTSFGVTMMHQSIPTPNWGKNNAILLCCIFGINSPPTPSDAGEGEHHT